MTAWLAFGAGAAVWCVLTLAVLVFGKAAKRAGEPLVLARCTARYKGGVICERIEGHYGMHAAAEYLWDEVTGAHFTHEVPRDRMVVARGTRGES